jgi:hypothetical protein
LFDLSSSLFWGKGTKSFFTARGLARESKTSSEGEKDDYLEEKKCSNNVLSHFGRLKDHNYILISSSLWNTFHKHYFKTIYKLLFSQRFCFPLQLSLTVWEKAEVLFYFKNRLLWNCTNTINLNKLTKMQQSERLQGLQI